MIVLAQQNQQAKAKLTELLINNNVQFSENKNHEYEATLKIKIKKDDSFLKSLQLRLQYLSREMEIARGFRGLQTELRRRKLEKLRAEHDDVQRIIEIHQRSEKFSEQLKNQEFSARDVSLEEIEQLFRSVFFNNNKLIEETKKREQRVIQFCFQTYKSQHFQDRLNGVTRQLELKHELQHSQAQQKLSVLTPLAITKAQYHTPVQQKRESPKTKQSSVPSVAQRPRSTTPKKLNIDQLSSQQLQTYYNRLLRQPQSEHPKRCSPTNQKPHTPTRLFKV